jgi:hypothetical protein
MRSELFTEIRRLINATDLELVKVVAYENVAVALEQPVDARSHHLARARLDSGEVKTGEARAGHAKSLVAVALVVCGRKVEELLSERLG